MNYQKHYDALIERAKTRTLDGYSERHHIVPKCLGGSNEPSNLVQLTAEEHYIAHQLLLKLYPKHRGIAYAVIRMTTSTHGHRRNNKLYGWIRKAVGAAQKGKRKPTGVKPWNFGKSLTDDIKQKISKTLSGTKHPPRPEQWCQSISKSKKAQGVSAKQLAQLKGVHELNRGKPRPASQKEAVKKALTGRVVSEATKEKQRLAQQARRNRERSSISE